MKRHTALPELLSPAGSYEALVAAVNAGADAVYLGGKSFNARAYAQNFDMPTLVRGVQYAHLFGVRVYVTLNTLIFDREMNDVISYARQLYEAGVDALIVADLGAISEIKKHIPQLELHASTQATVHSSLGADELFSLGVSRVVLSRELSLENITLATSECRCETEVFVHGALCVCHSGQCLFSSLVGRRSGNRGECAQPCRLPYNSSYPLSLRDLCLAEHIPALIDSGVASLKIEGRMKSPAYVYEVTRIYRALLNERRSCTREEKARLAAVFSRDGFTDKYFTDKKEEKMTGTRGESDKQASRELDGVTICERKLPIVAKCEIKRGECATLTLSSNGVSATAVGQIPTDALTSPLTEEGVVARLCKMGATVFSLSPDDIDLSLDEGLNLPPSSLNSLRRDACEELLRTLTEYKSDDATEFKPRVKESPSTQKIRRSALCFAIEQYEAIRKTDFFDKIYLGVRDIEALRSPDEMVGVYVPPVIFDTELDIVRSLLISAKEKGVTDALIGNISHYALCREIGLTPHADFRMNILNSQSVALHRSLGCASIVLSPELTLPQIRDLHDGLAIVYGRIPLMLLERCFMKENFGCDKCSKCSLTDRLGMKFPLLREFDHRNLLFNSVETYMGDKKDLLEQYKICGEHFIFTTETPKRCVEVINAYENGEAIFTNPKRILK